jgi:hypothetical protein
MTESINAFDGENEIVYSADFIIYQNKLILKNVIEEYSFEFLFENELDKTGQINWIGDDLTKLVKVKLINFNNSLGTGSTQPLPMLKTHDGKQILISVYAKTLNGDSEFRKVSVTFYKK